MLGQEDKGIGHRATASQTRRSVNERTDEMKDKELVNQATEEEIKAVAAEVAKVEDAIAAI